MRIKDILTGHLQKLNRSRRKNETADAPGEIKKGSSGSKAKPTDSTNISPEAKDLAQAAKLITESVEALKAMPDVRADAVTLAKKRVASGYYDSPKVIESVASIIAEHLVAESPVSSSDLATDIIADIDPKNADLTQQDLDTIRENLEKGLYQSEDVVQDVAEKILQFLGEIRDNNQ